MDPLLDRIAERRALLCEQAERLRKELAEVEAELERVSSAEQVVAQLLAEADDGADEGPDGDDRDSDRDGGRGASVRPALTVPHRASGVTADELPGEYRRIMQIVAEEGQGPGGVACKRVTVKLGLTTESRHTEGVRGKLKRLVARGWLVEAAPGRFTLCP